MTPETSIEQYILRNWSTEDGLSSNTINQMTIGGDHYLWLATYNGLVRFDGHRFVVYSKNNTHLLKTNTIYAVHTDAKGKVYTSTHEGEIFYIDDDLRLQRVKGNTHTDPVLSLYTQGDTLWYGTRGKGPGAIIDGKEVSMDNIPMRLKKAYINVMTEYQNKLLIGTEGDGIFSRRGNTFDTLIWKNQEKIDPHVNCFRNIKGKLYIGTQKGVYVVENNTVSELAYFTEDQVTGIVTDSHNSIWYSTHNGLVREKANGSYERLTKEEGLPHERLSCLEFDEEGDLWLGSYRKGLLQIRGGKFTNISEQEGFTNSTVNTVCEIGNKKYLVGLDNGDIMQVEGQNVTLFPLQYDIKTTIKHLRVDSQNRLWISTYEGLIFASLDGKIIKHYTVEGGLSSEKVRITIEDDKGNIWIGTRSGGITILQKDGTLKYLSKNNGLHSDFIMDLEQGPDKKIYIATNEAGLEIINEDFSIENISENLPSKLIFNVFFTKSGELLLSSNGYIIRLKGKEVQTVSMENGLYTNTFFDMLEDQDSNLWITSPEGIVKVSLKQLNETFDNPKKPIKAELFTEKDGLNTRICTGAVQAFSSSDQTFFFPTLGGVVYIHPSSIPKNKYIPPIRVETVTTDSISYSRNDTLIFPSDVLRYIFHFTAFSYRSPSNVYFKYQLVGYDPDWIFSGAERTASYTRLNPGKYTFRVIACNNDGVWNEKPEEFHFEITPLWHQRNSVKIALLIPILGLFYMFYTVRMRSIKRSKERLEELVNQRTAMIQSQKEEIMRQKEDIENQHQFIEAKNKDLAKSHEIIELVNLVGQKVTSELKTDHLIPMLYEQLKNILPSDIFGIGIFQQERNRLFFTSGIIDGETVPDHVEDLASPQSLACQAFLLKEDIVIDDYEVGYTKYTNKPVFSQVINNRKPLSLIYLPLYIEDRILGVLTIQSYEKNAYDDHQLIFLKALRSYLSVALENSASYHTIAEANQQITDSIRYAKTIQQAILPTEEEFKANFQSFEILYLPRDIVSGDYYWMYRRENTVFLAVMDCTGHGVPGAFMSMIGSALLSEAVHEKKLNEPHEIFEWVDFELRNILHQQDQANTDGMEGSICKIEYTDSGVVKIDHCGAKSSIVYLEKNTEKWIRLTGNKRGLGGIFRVEKEFTSNQLELSKGDKICLYTDGYIDQSNASLKKIGTPGLLNLLDRYKDDSLEHMGKCFLDALTEHKGDVRQRDDITLIWIEL